MEYRWDLRPAPPEDEVRDLAGRALIDPVVAAVLHQRGYRTPEAIEGFLAPDLSAGHDPFLLTDMAPAVERITAAVKAGERIRVHGDYDVDGITATALMVRTLLHMGADVDAHIPHRTEEGYGLSEEAVERARRDGIAVLITVDCGTTAVEEATLAARYGIDLVITDHHTPGAELPAALAVINPMREGDAYPFKHLAGVGVAFKLALALNPPDLGPTLMDLLDLVALGTTADVVPLKGENRVFVKYGLCQMGRTRWPGVGALIDRADLHRERLTATDIVFQIAPRINAVGRMADANEALHLMLTDDGFEAAELARDLDRHNVQRRKADEDTLRRALQQVEELADLDQRRSLMLCSSEWHPGVVGIVASRLVERYHLPTVLVAFDGDLGKGSARSIGGFNLYEALSECTSHLESFGGHQYAAGLTLSREKIESFRAAFESAARNRLSDADMVPSIDVDIEVEFDHLTSDLLQGLKRMAPFGADNRRPVFMIRGIETEGHARRVGSDRSHLRFAVRRNGEAPLDVIAFRMGDRADEIGKGPLDLVFTFEENEFRGIRKQQLRLKDMRPNLP